MGAADEMEQITRAAELTLNGLHQSVRYGTVDTLKATLTEVDWRLSHRTPVDTGRTRANWNVGVGAPDATVDVNKFDPSGEETHERAKSVIDSITESAIGKDIFITNGLPYIGALEHGHSQKAPLGMIVVTEAEIPFIAAQAAQQVMGGLHFRGGDLHSAGAGGDA